MTQEEKKLLLQDLCARLQCGVKLDFYSRATNEHYVSILLGIEPNNDDKPIIAKVNDGAYTLGQDHIKPYLRPMSSMTEEEKKELINIGPYLVNGNNIVIGVQCNSFVQISKCQEWLNKKMFDYRGLIERGLAIAVTEENNPYKE